MLVFFILNDQAVLKRNRKRVYLANELLGLREDHTPNRDK